MSIMDLKEAIELARSGRALAFLGAGFSVGSANIAGGAMKSGQGFSDLLAADVALPAGTGLTDTSEAYLDSFGAPALANLYKGRIFGGLSIASSGGLRHHTLAIHLHDKLR
jgi:hypothetical protein